MPVYYLWAAVVFAYLTSIIGLGLLLASKLRGGVKWILAGPSVFDKNHLYAVVLLERGIKVNKEGEWAWEISYHNFRRTYSGHWRRYGRWVFFYPAPKTNIKKQPKFKPGFNFG